MLPVSVLPVAGLLLGIGSAKFTWLPPALSNVMAQSGGAIFGNLPLIFAIGVALGVTQNDGVAALAAVVGYAVMLATMGVMAALFGYEPKAIMGIQSIETGVFGGIVDRRHRGVAVQPVLPDPAAAVPRLLRREAVRPDRHGAGVHRRRHRPERRVAADRTRDRRASRAGAASGNPAAAFALYGVVERSLIPFGLHHIWNVPFFFEVGQYVDPATGK